MFYQIKRFIRDNESLMYVLSAIYCIFGWNRVKGKNGNIISGGVHS